ncbi:glutathione S-transferase T3-like [Primulina eburnea]|uniref:glutathione S-transferase T3-like n=1 Tax=Primulina eburnea TaxID=1245227 RepID=UPI003C6BF482
MPIENEPPTPTFVLETRLSDRETRVDLENVQNTDVDVEGTKKRIIWKKEEDELLARSYVTMSDDPVIGNDQKGNDFWRRVADHYNENRPAGSSRRALNVIRSHWHNTVQKKVNGFNANYNSVYNTYRSGHSDEDILRFAYEKYRDENNGVAFNLEHVWRIMKTRPLFTPQSDDHLVGTKKARISESGASNTSSNKDASIDLDINEEEIRPIGQKVAKIKGKNKAKSSMKDLTTRYDSLFESFTQYTDIKKNESEWKQKELAIEEMKAKAALNKSEAKKSKYLLKEYEILSKDTSQMTPEQLLVHEHMCDQIRDKWNM